MLDTISKKKLAKRDSVFGTEDNESLASSDTTTITARMNDLADVSFLSSAYSADDRTLKIGLNKERYDGYLYLRQLIKNKF